MSFRRKKELQIKIIKQIYPLTLDQKWHALFSKHKSIKMRELENKLNSLLKSQGQATNDFKEYSQLKRKLLADILGGMPEAFDSVKDDSMQSMEKNKKYVDEINLKLKKLENKLVKLPKEIEGVNSHLLELSMASCYGRIMKHKGNLSELDTKISRLREELKDLMVKKNESKEEYDLLYTYMHDLVGPEVIEQFDQLYFGGKAQ